MKLKSHLKDAPLETLQSIAEFWNATPEPSDSATAVADLAEYLYPRLQSPAHFKAAFERLEVSERELIYFLALHGGELPVEEFRRRTGLHDDAAFEQVLHRLNARGFLWRESVQDEDLSFEVVGISEPFVRLVDLPPYWRGFLGHYLQELPLTDLKEIARRAIQYRFSGSKKQALVHHLRARLLDPAVLREILAAQSPPEKELFQQILKKNGACVWRDLLDGGVQKKFNHAKAEMLDQLTVNSGLVYVWRPGANKYNNMVMVPRDLSHIINNGYRQDERTLDELSRSVGDRSRGGRGQAGGYPSVVLDNSGNILRDLAILLAHVRRHKLKMLNNGGFGRNDLKKIAPHLSHNKTPKYAAFLALFAMSRKLLIPVGEEWRVSKGVPAWLKDSRAAFRDLYAFWLGANEWNEEFIEGDVVHVDTYPQNLIGATELRKLILRVLEKAPYDTWIDFETFADSLLPQVAIEIPGRFDHSPAEKNSRHTMLIMESIIAEPLYWLGLVTLGVSDLEVARELGSRTNETIMPLDLPCGSPIVNPGQYAFSFKTSPPARALFDGKYLDPSQIVAKRDDPGQLYASDAMHGTVQPNLEIVTPPDFNLSSLFQLLAFTDVKKVDIMTTLSISRESIRMGMEEGLKGGDIVEILRGASRRELPETVINIIEECGARHGEVDIGVAGGYMATSNPLHIEEMRNNNRINRYIKDVFGDKLVLLNRTVDFKKLGKELEKMGFLPHVTDEGLQTDAEGLFHVTLRQDELHSLLAILQFAQGLEDELDGPIFEDRIRPLQERFSHEATGDYSPAYYIDPVVAAYRKNFEKLSGKRKDEEAKKLKKQVNRLLTKMPRSKEPERYPGENPTNDPAGVAKMMRYAIEHEMPVKIHYLRSTGEEVDEVIVPETFKGERVYALCQDLDEHHFYSVKRIAQAAI